MNVLRFLGEGTAGVALSVLFTIGIFSILPFVGLIALGFFGAVALVGLLFIGILFWVPSLVIGCAFLSRKAKVFGWSMIATGLVISVWIQLWMFGSGLLT